MVQLILHMWGDYLTQSDWMANEKTKHWFPALAHALSYSLPFFFIGSWQAVLVIFASHYLIDRYRLVKYFLRWKEWRFDQEWGYITAGENAKPAWMWVWLMIAADNTLHLTCNYLALTHL